MSRKPNILFLLNDHQAYYRHGWDGGAKVQRPHFDRLASGGILFNRAYTACPLCGPARRTMLTGLFPHNHGEIKNDSDHPYDREVYLDILAANGYRNYYYGKWHAGAGTAHDDGCDGCSYPSYNNPYTKPEYKEYLRARGLGEPEILIERMFWQYPNMRVGELYRQERDWCNEHAAGILQASAETHEAFFLANLACEKLRELAAEDSEQPFSFRVDFWGPHQPYFPTQEYADMYRPEEIPEYGNFRDELADKPEIYRTEGNAGISKDGKLLVPNPLPWSEWQRVLARCYAQIALIDAAGGRILATLDELGLAENTLVIWTTDHGDAVACHGGHFDKASYMPEEMVRIPMAVRFDGRISPGQVSDSLVSNLDVAPTLLDAAGTAFEGEIDGTSLLPLCRRQSEQWREDLMCQTHGHGDDHIGRMVVTGRYKYVANRGQMDELYDLAADPYERKTLIANPAHKDALADMKRRLAAWQRKSNDGQAVLE
jgi:arylsulfatase A-like enzyme